MSDHGCGDPRCRVDYCRGSQTEVKNDSALTLRDRIAAALGRAWLATDDPGPVVLAALADAVIAELGLRREDNEADFTGSYRHRYVTDWRADDE